MNDRVVTIAKIGSSFKLQGELKIYLLSNTSYIYIKKNNNLYIKNNKYDDAWKIMTKYTINNNNTLIKFHDALNKEQATLKYTNALIGIIRKDLIITNNNEFYYIDLIGLKVINKDKLELGIVFDILNNGFHDIIICRSKYTKEYFIPFINNYIIDVKLSLGKIIVDWHTDY